jgi:hypothetical protein
MSVNFTGGWIPTPPERPRVRMTAALREEAAPLSVNFSLIPTVGMHLNDEWGDCTIGADANIVQQQSYYGQGSEVVVPDAACLLAYEIVGHFNPKAGPPGNNPTDNGAQIPDALQYLKVKGMCGVTIAAYGDVEHVQTGKIKTAIWEFGAVSFGVNLPTSAMTQFNNGQAWDYNPKLNNSIEGGHCVLGVGYNPSGFLAFTWGGLVLITWTWWAQFGAEAWPVVSHEWINKHTGVDPEGVDLAVLGTEFRAETGHNPFPAPTAAPAPGPVPPAPAGTSPKVRGGLTYRFLRWLAENK